MTLYEHDKNDQSERRDTRAADAGQEKAARPSLLSRIRRAFAPKMAVWLITPAGCDDSVIYAAPTKKAAFAAAHALVFRHFFPHYSSWLPLHGYGDPDEFSMPQYGLRSDAWQEYLSANVDAADEYLSTLEIHRAVYDREAFSSMIRIMCGSAPLGLDFESDEEIEYWLSAAEAALAEAHEEEAKEKEKEEENPSAPLDNTNEKDHNVSEQENNAGAKRGPGRPRKKGGSAKKAPGAKKGDTNEK